MNGKPRHLLVEADLFLSYLTEDELAPLFDKIVDQASEGRVKLFVSSEVYDDLVSALRSQGVPPLRVLKFISDCATIPHEPLPINC